jgi:hypothetical protein
LRTGGPFLVHLFFSKENTRVIEYGNRIRPVYGRIRYKYGVITTVYGRIRAVYIPYFYRNPGRWFTAVLIPYRIRRVYGSNTALYTVRIWPYTVVKVPYSYRIRSYRHRIQCHVLSYSQALLVNKRRSKFHPLLPWIEQYYLYFNIILTIEIDPCINLNKKKR